MTSFVNDAILDGDDSVTLVVEVYKNSPTSYLCLDVSRDGCMQPVELTFKRPQLAVLKDGTTVSIDIEFRRETSCQVDDKYPRAPSLSLEKTGVPSK